MNQSKKVTEGALLIAVFAILILIGTFVPFSMLLIVFVLPLPFIIFTYKYRWKSALVMLGAAVILSLIIAVISLPITALAGFGGIMIGIGLHDRLSPYETWARGTIGFIAGLLFIFLFTQYFLEINWASEIDLVVDESFQISKELMEQFGIAAQIEQELNIIQEQLSFITNLMPVGIAMIAIVMAFIAQWLGYKVVNRLENQDFTFPPFRNFKLPVAVVWIYFFGLLFTLFDTDPSDLIFIVASNVVMLAGFFVALQGFSFIFFFSHFKNWSIAVPILSIIFTLLFPMLLLYFIRIIGIIDLGFRLRDRFSNHEN